MIIATKVSFFKKVKIANRSITNLKSHLGRRHHLERFLTESQLRQLNKFGKQNFKISKKEKNELDELALNAIVMDSCSFNVFSKPGMKNFIEKLRPGYTPLNRKSAARRLKRK